jgi:HSP20 family molecular chaperone IbpA
MWHKDRVLVRSVGLDHPWFHKFHVSYDPGRERMYPNEPRVWHPPTDVYETDNDLTVKMEIAGVEEDDFEVHLHGRVMTVHGFRTDPADKLSYQQMEISYGEFLSQVYLPVDVDGEQVRATYEDGFLSVVLPKGSREHKVAVVVIEHDSDKSDK